MCAIYQTDWQALWGGSQCGIMTVQLAVVYCTDESYWFVGAPARRRGGVFQGNIVKLCSCYTHPGEAYLSAADEKKLMCVCVSRGGAHGCLHPPQSDGGVSSDQNYRKSAFRKFGKN